MTPQIVIDFDSTIVQCETLDELARIALDASAKREEIIAKIKSLTDQGMEGRISIEESLKQRIALLTATREHISKLIPILSSNISPSFLRHKDFLRNNCARISILSAGFQECIVPVAKILGLSIDRIFSNTLVFNSNGTIEGIDINNPLSKAQGKIIAIQELRLQSPIHVIGDGYTDYEIFKLGKADAFFAFTETARRESVVTQPNIHVINTFDEYLSITAQL